MYEISLGPCVVHVHIVNEDHWRQIEAAEIRHHEPSYTDLDGILRRKGDLGRLYTEADLEDLLAME